MQRGKQGRMQENRRVSVKQNSRRDSGVERIITRCPVLILEMCEHVTLHRKRDLAGVRKDLESNEIILDYLNQHNGITSILVRQRQEAQSE